MFHNKFLKIVAMLTVFVTQANYAYAADFLVRVPVEIDNWGSSSATVECNLWGSSFFEMGHGRGPIQLEDGTFEGTIEVPVVIRRGVNSDEIYSVTCALDGGEYLMMTQENCTLAGLTEDGFRCVPSHIRFTEFVEAPIAESLPQ